MGRVNPGSWGFICQVWLEGFILMAWLRQEGSRMSYASTTIPMASLHLAWRVREISEHKGYKSNKQWAFQQPTEISPMNDREHSIYNHRSNVGSDTAVNNVCECGGYVWVCGHLSSVQNPRWLMIRGGYIILNYPVYRYRLHQITYDILYHISIIQYGSIGHPFNQPASRDHVSGFENCSFGPFGSGHFRSYRRTWAHDSSQRRSQPSSQAGTIRPTIRVFRPFFLVHGCHALNAPKKLPFWTFMARWSGKCG